MYKFVFLIFKKKNFNYLFELIKIFKKNCKYIIENYFLV